MSWTQFMDMHSGGGAKEDYEYIFIEASQDEAEIIFYNRFGHSPNKVTCTCCGEDYSVSESEDLKQATAYERNCLFAWFDKDGNRITRDEAWVSGEGYIEGSYSRYIEEPNLEFGRSPDDYMTIKQYMKKGDALFIKDSEIKPEERQGEVPQEGYVWQ